MQFIFLAILIALSCTTQNPELAPEKKPKPPTQVKPRPEIKSHKFRWNHEYNDYFIVQAIDKYGPELLSVRPNDYKDYIDQWPDNRNGIIKFWGNLLVEMAYWESKWDGSQKYRESFKNSSGNRIWSRGLFQLSFESARGYKCPIKKESDLHVDSLNIQCAVIIMNHWLKRDKVIRARVGNKWRGGARYWAVLRGTSGDHTRTALKGIMGVNR